VGFMSRTASMSSDRMSSDLDKGPNLLLDWHEPTDPRRWFRAGIGSIVVHILLLLGAFAIGTLDVPQPRTATEIASNIQRVTLYTPSDLTQKAPNKSKVSKEVNVEDLKPRPASEQRLPPAPAVRTFKPPVPQKTDTPKPGSPTEPPKLEAAAPPPNLPPPAAGVPKAQPPPEIQPEEKPKLAFETPGQHGTNSQQSQSKVLSPPKTTLQDAINSVARGGGQRGVVVEELEPPPTLPESMRLPAQPGRSGSSLELLSDPLGVDFKPYLIQILARVRRNWFAVIPESAKMGNRGEVLLQFIIDRDGQVPKLVIATPSGAESLDRAAVAGISASVPFPPLPKEFKGKEVRLQFAFKYNIK
jgi:TonB family protein